MSSGSLAKLRTPVESCNRVWEIHIDDEDDEGRRRHCNILASADSLKVGNRMASCSPSVCFDVPVQSDAKAPHPSGVSFLELFPHLNFSAPVRVAVLYTAIFPQFSTHLNPGREAEVSSDCARGWKLILQTTTGVQHPAGRSESLQFPWGEKRFPYR